MGMTKYAKYVNNLPNNEKQKILNIIEKMFLYEGLSEKQIANKLNTNVTAIHQIRLLNGILKNNQQIVNDRIKKQYNNFLITNDYKYITIEVIKKFKNEKAIKKFIQIIYDKLHNELLTKNEIANELNITIRLINYIINIYNITLTKEEKHKVFERKKNNKSKEEKKIEFLNRSNGQKNRTLEQKHATKQKYEATMIKKYGVKHNWQIPEIKEKVKNNSIKKYGIENPINSIKAKQTKLEKYGDENYNNREKYKETYKAFSKDKLQQIKEKTQQTCLKRYGVTHPMKNNKIKDKLQQVFINKYGVNNPFQINPYENNAISKLNLKFKELLLDGFNIIPELEFNLNNSYYDFKIGNLLIELNPTITHNSTISFSHLIGVCTNENCTKHKPLDRNYHFNKWLLAKDNGYELISIFDWYDIIKIMSLIKAKLQLNDIKIGARQTIIKQIDKNISKNFLNQNHILGYDRSSDIIYGLYYNNKLVSVMSFGKPRYSKKYDWELLRFANLSNYTIYGAASKLWKQFLKDYSPKSVITYTNNDFGNGYVYKKLGFKEIDVLKNNKIWNIPYKNIFIKHSSLIRQGADRLLKNKIDGYFPVGLNYNDFIKRGGKEEYKDEYSILSEDTNWWPGNIDIMRHYGFVEVYSSGTTIYAYFNK